MKSKYFLKFIVYSKSILFVLESFFRKQFLSFEEKSIYLFFLSLRNNNFSNKKSHQLTEFIIYPKKTKKIFPFTHLEKKVSIIIQGDIFNYDFVKSTIDWYKSCGINNIIVSTNQFEKKFNNANTLVNKKTMFKSLFDENDEILNTKAALEYIPNDHLVIKTKTNQRIMNETVISQLHSIHDSYHSKLSRNKKRLGVISSKSSLIYVNNISADIYIGSLEQMLEIFSIGIRDRELYFKDLDIDENNLENYIYNNKNLFISKPYFLSELNNDQRLFNSFRRNCLIKDMSDKNIIKKNEYLDSLSTYIDIIADCLYVLDPSEID